MGRQVLSSPAPIRTRSEDRFDLTSLFEFSSHINATLDLNFILNHYLLTIMGKLLSPRGALLLEKQEHRFFVANVKGVSRDLMSRDMVVKRFSRRVTYVSEQDGRRHPWLKLFREANLEILIPLVARDRVVGIAAFGARLSKKKLSTKEETYVRSLSNIAAAAIEKSLMIDELRVVNRRLDAKVQELNTLFELSKEFNAVLDSDRLVKLLAYSLLGQIGTNRFFIGLKEGKEMNIVQSRLGEQFPPHLSARCLSMTAPLVVDGDAAKDASSLHGLLKSIGIKVLVPLRIQDETKGVIGLGEKMRGEEYSANDLDFLFSLGNLAIISAENARLFREGIEKQKMEDELLIAREIQRGLLPSKLPPIPNADLAAVNLSSKQVGGDYYDVIGMGNDRFILAIGDVSGKGTPASLLMANLQATIRALVPFGLQLGELTARVNNLICDNTGADRFITFFWGMYEAPTGCFRYVNAGHNPPFLFRASGIVERLEAGGIILGVLKTEAPYEEGEVILGPGDRLVCFTDGVSEAMNKSDEEFGEAAIEAIAESDHASSSMEFLTQITEAVRLHGKGVPQSDDITVMVLTIAGDRHA